MVRRIATFAATIGWAVSSFAGPSYVPVVNGLFTTGQWYFDGSKSELGGNAAVTFVPALRFSNSFSLLPAVQSNYRGTRTTEELAGGNTFFHDTWENGVGVKAVHGLNSNWNLRENAGYRFKWFRETVDETWNHGLYDYRIYNVGTELERHWGRAANIAVGYDFSYLQFPNYNSLESTQGADRSREFSGSNVLDNRIHLFSFRAQTPLFWKMTANVQTFLSPRDYTDQNVVVVTGLLTPEHRKDMYFSNTLSLGRVFNTPLKSKLIASVNYNYASLDSNQNHYDARQTFFAADYYDYDLNAVGTQLTLAFGNAGGNPMVVDAGYTYSNRQYRSRPIQAEDGSYENEKLFQVEQMINLGFSYPLSRSFRVRTTAAFGQSRSNNSYEAVYRYNYHNAEYQFGFTYDY